MQKLRRNTDWIYHFVLLETYPYFLSIFSFINDVSGEIVGFEVFELFLTLFIRMHIRLLTTLFS